MESAQLDWPARLAWHGSLLSALADSGYALARFALPLAGGQAWQAWAYRLLVAYGAHQVQGPGTLHLFGYRSSSGLAHEIDAAGISDVALVLEAKDQPGGIAKEQVDSFDGRTMDYFEGAIQRGWNQHLFRIMWCTSPTHELIRRYCARRGIVIVGPDRAPIPTLLAAAGRWDAVEWLSDQHLSDLVTLGERACHPLRATKIGRGLYYQYPLNLWTANDLDDLEYLHALSSAQWLNWLDSTDPLHHERHAERCLHTLSGWAELRNAARPIDQPPLRP